MLVRNCNSWVGRESWSQRALALCIRETWTDCLQGGDVNFIVGKDWFGWPSNWLWHDMSFIPFQSCPSYSSCSRDLWRWNRQSVLKCRHKIQMPGNHRKWRIQYSQQSESLK
jgi:hypothetical protein